MLEALLSISRKKISPPVMSLITSSGDVPSPNVYAGGATDGNRFYIACGSTGDGLTSNICYSCNTSGVWTKHTNMTNPRFQVPMLYSDTRNAFYTFWGTNRRHCNVLQLPGNTQSGYNITTGPDPRQDFAAFMHSGNIMVWGGQVGTTYHNTMLTVVPGATTISSGVLPQYGSIPSIRKGPAFYADGETYLYIVGGYGKSEEEVTKDRLLNDCYRYHIPTRTWTRLNDLPFTTAHGCLFYANGILYLINGLNANVMSNEVWALNLRYYPAEKPAWVKLGNTPGVPTRGSASAVINGSMYIFGGGYTLTDDLNNQLIKFTPSF